MADDIIKPTRIVQIATTTAEGHTLYVLDQAGGLFAMEDPPDDDLEDGGWLQIAPPTKAGRIVQLSVVSGDEDTADYLYALDDRGDVYFVANPTDPDGAWVKVEAE